MHCTSDVIFARVFDRYWCDVSEWYSGSTLAATRGAPMNNDWQRTLFHLLLVRCKISQLILEEPSQATW